MINIIEKRIDEKGGTVRRDRKRNMGKSLLKKVFKNQLINLIIAALFILAFAAFEFWDYYIPIEDIWI